MKKAGLLAAAGLAFSVSVSQADTINLTFASGYGSALAWTDEEVNTFLPGVNAELKKMGSDHRVEWTVAVDGTLASMGNMLDAMSTGLADVGHIVHVFEPTRLPLQNVPSVVPFGTEDPAIASRALDELNRSMPAMQKAWDDLNLVYLTSFSFDSYLLFSRYPIEKLEDVQGRKIAAAAGNLPWLENTGAIGITGTSATAYSDTQNGVYDALVNSALLGRPGKLHEVAPYVIRTGFGAINIFDIVANKTSWEAMPEDVRKAIEVSAANLQEAVIERLVADRDASFDAMAAEGAKISDLPQEERVKWIEVLPNIAERWVNDLEGKGLPAREVLEAYLAKLEEQGVDLPRDWADF
jgi:TRAP-type C4-dicarboxylate transport system substrate-binding protein